MALPSLLLLAAADDVGARPLMDALSAHWTVTICVPRALVRYAGPEQALAELRRQAARADLVLYLSPDGAAGLAGMEGLVEVYAPADFALCRLGPEERSDPAAWERLWREERDLARRARLVAVPAEDIALKARLLYGIGPARLRQVAPDELTALLREPMPPPPGFEPPPRFTLALNDYLLGSMNHGGAVRVRQGLDALGEETVLLSLGIHGATTFVAPRVLQVSVPKGRDQRLMEAGLRALGRPGMEDILSAMHAPLHAPLVALAADLARRARVAVFEHCYMAPLLEVMRAAAPALPIVYDAHNVESRLKRELLEGHPAAAALCPYVEEIERRLVAAAGLVLCCSEADAEAFRPQARRVVMMPHGVPPALPSAPPPGGQPPRVGFLGSAHPPNRDAARYILDQLAPQVPGVVFEFVGAVCTGLHSGLSNVVLRGVVTEEEKVAALAQWTLALNPVEGGSGASLKLSDYLAHALPTLNTPHAARGFSRVAEGAGLVVPLAEFPAALGRLLNEPGLLGTLRKAARMAAEAQSWPAVAREARKAIDALVGGYAPPARQALLALGVEAAQEGRLHPGYDRVDLLRQDDTALPAMAADRVLVLPPLLAEPWEPEAGRQRAWLDAQPEAAQSLPAPCAAFGIRGAGQAVAAQFGLLLPAGTLRVALEWEAAAPVEAAFFHAGLEGGAPVLLARLRWQGRSRTVLPLPPSGAPWLLEGRLYQGGAAHLTSATILAPVQQAVALDLPAPPGPPAHPLPPEWRGWLRRHAADYAALLAPPGLARLGLPAPGGERPSAAALAPLGGLLGEAASAHQGIAAVQALGVTGPFTLSLEAGPGPSGPVVRYADGLASYRDADGVLREARMPLGWLLLSTRPPCQALVAAERPAVEALAALAGVPVLRP